MKRGRLIAFASQFTCALHRVLQECKGPIYRAIYVVIFKLTTNDPLGVSGH